MTNNKYYLEIKTIQATAFKVLIEALKELLIDTYIIFDDTGMKIFTVDTAHVVIIHLKLKASEFEHYYCEKSFSIGVNMINFHKVIKTINNGDTLTLFIDKSDMNATPIPAQTHDDKHNNLGMNYLGIRIENGQKNTKTTYKLDLYDLDVPEQIHIEPIEYNSIITMPSSDFQKIVRDMSNIAQEVEIKNIDNHLIFSCKGDFCFQETVLTDSPAASPDTMDATPSSGDVFDGKKNKVIIYNKNLDKITQGIFNLRYLVVFTKCTNLSNTVELSLQNNLPLIVQYNIASLGTITLANAPTLR